MKSIFLLIVIVSSTSCFSITKSELEQEGYNRLESSFEHMGIGLVEIGIGALQFSRGDPIGGAAGIGLGVKDIKDSIQDFKDAKDLYDRSREVDDD